MVVLRGLFQAHDTNAFDAGPPEGTAFGNAMKLQLRKI